MVPGTNVNNFFDDLRAQYFEAVKGPVTFLFTDNEIKQERCPGLGESSHAWQLGPLKSFIAAWNGRECVQRRLNC